jgi:DNA helicase-2/ATP-dependent DNA helicase PcrA
MAGMIGSLEDALEQRVPLGEIAEVAANFAGSIEEFIGTMDRALRQARRTNAGQDAGGVALLTYFRSKGLQWHTVILTSCNEGLIPHWRAPIEEERRLFYVAMTRPSANLLVSYLANALNQKVAPSRFLREAGLLTAGEA